MARVQWSAVVVLFALLCMPLAHAAVFSIDVTPVENDIMRNESAEFSVRVSNYQGVDARFQVYTIDPTWNLKTTPITPTVPAQGDLTFTLTARPSADAPIGAQGLSITFKDLVSGTLIKKDLVLNLRGSKPFIGEYEPTVALNVIMPYDVDPREPVPLRLEMRNRNSLNIANLSVRVHSPHFGAVFDQSLPPLSERTRDVPDLALDPRTRPGEAELTVTLVMDGETINQLQKNYKVKAYSTIRERVEEESFLFKTVKRITVVNDGNVDNAAVVTVPTSFVKALFVSSDTPYERSKVDDGSVLMWNVPLAPDETASLTYVENYRILILLAILGFIGGIVYVLLRSPVVLLKEAVGVAKEDGVSRIKVRIFVRNRTSKLIRDVQVTDRVPSLADVVSAEAPGSIAPSKVAVSDKKGTLLRWQLDVLEPYEERLLTYHAKSKLKIIGRMSLPNAKARFMVRGKERAVYSNNLELVERFKDR